MRERERIKRKLKKLNINLLEFMKQNEKDICIYIIILTNWIVFLLILLQIKMWLWISYFDSK